MCYNAIAREFRGANLHHISKCLDILQLQKRNNQRFELSLFFRHYIDHDSVNDAYLIYDKLKKSSNYQVRVEGRTLSIFSLEKDWLYDLSKKLRNCYSWYEPGEQGVAKPGEVVLKKENGFQFKVTFNGKYLSDDGVQWLLNNEGNIKLGKTFKSNLQNGCTYANGLYVYVKSEKVITLMNMIFCENIRSIDKVIIKPKIA